MRPFLGTLLFCAACQPAAQSVPAKQPGEAPVSSPGKDTQPAPLSKEKPAQLPTRTDQPPEEPAAELQDDASANQYKGRLLGFFRRGFVVNGLGLSAVEIDKLEASVKVDVAPDGTITRFVITSPSGNVRFDEAVFAFLRGKVGQAIPPPPEDRPDLQRATVAFQMKCSAACK